LTVGQSPWVPDGSWQARLGATWVFHGGKDIGPVPTASWFGVSEQESL
jgi:hypothetical protein